MAFWRRESKEVEIKAEEVKPETQEVAFEEPEEKPKFAPLFVKIDRYREVLGLLEKGASEAERLRELLGLLREVESTRAEVEAKLKETVSSLSETLRKLDEEFVRPEGMEEAGERKEFRSVDTEELRKVIKELGEKLKE